MADPVVSSIKLACFEIGDTILPFRLGEALASNATIADLDAYIARNTSAPGGIRNRDALRQTLHEMLEKGIGVAITSGSDQQHLIPHVLDKIGLEPQDREKIVIIAPTKRRLIGERYKSMKEIFNEAAATLGINAKPGEIVRVDYNTSNLDHASLDGFKTVNAVKDGTCDWLNKLRKLAGLAMLEERTEAIAPPVRRVDWAQRRLEAEQQRASRPPSASPGDLG